MYFLNLNNSIVTINLQLSLIVIVYNIMFKKYIFLENCHLFNDYKATIENY